MPLRYAEYFGPEELLSNSQFREVESLTAAPGWEQQGTTTITYSGVKVFKHKVALHCAPTAINGGVRQNITAKLTAGKWYTARAWMSSYGGGIGGSRGQLYCGNGSTENYPSTIQNHSDGQWKYHQVSFSPASLATPYYFICSNGDSPTANYPFVVGEVSLVEGFGDAPVFFPMETYEYGPEQSFRLADANVVGDYPHDLIDGEASKDAGVESVRFQIIGLTPEAIENHVSEIRSRVLRLGRSKLWLKRPDGTYLWAWARCASMPSLSFGYGSPRRVPVSLQFRRYSDWYGTVISGTVTVNNSSGGQTLALINVGDAEVDSFVFTIDSNSASDGIPPEWTLQNASNVKQIGGTVYTQIVRGSIFTNTINDIIRIRNQGMIAEWSNNNGASWAHIGGNVEGSEFYKGFITLVPGVNQVNFAWNAGLYGLCSVTLGYSYRPQWH